MPGRTAFLIRAPSPLWNALEATYTALPDVTVIGTALCRAEARAQVPALQPDVIVSDLEVEGTASLPLLTELRAHLPEAIIILVGGRSAVEDGTGLAGVRATGFLLWDNLNHPSFSAANDALLSGEFIVISRRAARAIREAQVRRRAAVESALTARERTVLGLLALGMAEKEIAERERLSLRTVERVIGDLKAKLDAPTLFVLGTKANRLGLVT